MSCNQPAFPEIKMGNQNDLMMSEFVYWYEKKYFGWYISDIFQKTVGSGYNMVQKHDIFYNLAMAKRSDFNSLGPCDAI